MTTHTATTVTTGFIRSLPWEVRECFGCRQQPYQAWRKIAGEWKLLGFADSLPGAEKKALR